MREFRNFGSATPFCMALDEQWGYFRCRSKAKGKCQNSDHGHENRLEFEKIHACKATEDKRLRPCVLSSDTSLLLTCTQLDM